jgi:CMP/dCMP kinase
MIQTECVITIDGPAGSGKSTVSRDVARSLGFVYLDTGAMYRAVALAAERRGMDETNGPELGELCRELDLVIRADGEINRLFLQGEEVTAAIRTPEMDMRSSAVSAVGEVRDAMTQLQRRLATRAGGVVAEGRDMGTVVFPEAPRKFFLTASRAQRAKRRYTERIERGETVSLEQVEEDLARRDRQDESRLLAPLRPAEDALVIDTTALTKAEVVSRILQIIHGED